MLCCRTTATQLRPQQDQAPPTRRRACVFQHGPDDDCGLVMAHVGFVAQCAGRQENLAFRFVLFQPALLPSLRSRRAQLSNPQVHPQFLFRWRIGGRGCGQAVCESPLPVAEQATGAIFQDRLVHAAVAQAQCRHQIRQQTEHAQPGIRTTPTQARTGRLVHPTVFRELARETNTLRCPS